MPPLPLCNLFLLAKWQLVLFPIHNEVPKDLRPPFLGLKVLLFVKPISPCLITAILSNC